MSVITVDFEDHGQDFLTWKIEDGIVTSCVPFQSWHWVGAKVLNEPITTGELLNIEIDGKRYRVKYPVRKIQKLTEVNTCKV